MQFITKDLLKPGMILSRDIELYNNHNSSTLLLSKGQALNNGYINKMICLDVAGAYVESEAFGDVNVKSYNREKLEAKALSQIKEVFNQFKMSTKKINSKSIKQISETVDELVTQLLQQKELACNIIEFKNYDDYTYQHCLNVATLSISTGISLGLSENMLHDLGMAGLLHDIGKMLIPLEIINKPGKLTDKEFEIMKAHPQNAIDQLKNIVSYDVLRGIESHHEKLDGTGYPFGRTRENISFYGKILAICDVYDALTSDRSYRKTCFPNEVIEYLMGCADTQFDYEILCKFLKTIVAYPIGSFVKLSNGNMGVVIKNYSENIMRPVVRIIDQDNVVGEDIDLLYDKSIMNVTIIGIEYEYGRMDYNKLSKLTP